jgi:hypothetical protein
MALIAAKNLETSNEAVPVARGTIPDATAF